MESDLVGFRVLRVIARPGDQRGPCCASSVEPQLLSRTAVKSDEPSPDRSARNPIARALRSSPSDICSGVPSKREREAIGQTGSIRDYATRKRRQTVGELHQRRSVRGDRAGQHTHAARITAAQPLQLRSEHAVVPHRDERVSRQLLRLRMNFEREALGEQRAQHHLPATRTTLRSRLKRIAGIRQPRPWRRCRSDRERASSVRR